jgi:4-hydroxyphenylpyruvate dioxygenase
MLSWSLFYTTLFQMQKSPMFDVVDPDGLVRSQALETLDGSFRITLNGAETHRTMAGHFLADSFGASVQHIAFATDDIFKTSSALVELGFKPLPMSDNYYADLDGLPPALLPTIWRRNVLRDRRAARKLPGIWRAERPISDCGPKASDAAKGNAKDLVVLI